MYGWGVSSRSGSQWESVEVIGSQITACVISLKGAVGIRWEPLGFVRSRGSQVPNQSPRRPVLAAQPPERGGVCFGESASVCD